MMENVTEDTIDIFVMTNGNTSDKFWAIDNVRSCVNDGRS